MSFRYRDGTQKNGVPIADAVAEIVEAVAEARPGMTETSPTDLPDAAVRPDELVAQDGVGVPDEFMRLWTPHRMAYIEGENKPTSRRPGRGARSAGCRGCRTTEAG